MTALLPEFFPGLTGFQWDAGNSEKNGRRHRVTRTEAEQVILNRPVVVASPAPHAEAKGR